jgi:hypothetical protein
MAEPFEEPAKTEMRASCEVAIDQAGHELVATLVRVDLPDNTSILGRLKGDLQSLDGEGDRYIYFLRPRAADTLPEWLAKLATAAHEIPGVKLYIVVDEATPSFERACRAAGAGLLLLTEDREFEVILDFDQTLPEAIEEAFRTRVEAARRSLDQKLDLHQNDLKARFEQIGQLTQGMASDVADKYSDNVERQYTIWTEWGHSVSAAIDAAFAERSTTKIAEIEAQIEAGPVLDEDVD